MASAGRLSSLPEVPTLIESGIKGFEAYAWQGLLVPKGTPRPVIERLSESLRGVLQDQQIQEKFTAMGLEATPGTPPEMDDYASAERERWGKLIREVGIKVQ